MTFILDSLLRLVGGGTRQFVPGNAGFADQTAMTPSAATPFGVAGLSKLMNQTGMVRGQPPTEYSVDGRNVRVQGFSRHPVVHACIRVVTELSSSVPLKAYRKMGDREIEQPTSELQRLLNRPGWNFSAKSLRASLIVDYQIYGNALIAIDRGIDPKQYDLSRLPKPKGLKRINPEGLQIAYVDGNIDVIAYVIRDQLGRVRTYDVADIIHFKDLDASPPDVPDIFGYPRAAAALTSMAADTEATRYTRQIVGNDGTPTLAVILNDEVDEEDAAAAQERWHQLAVERGRRGRAAFMSNVKDVKPIGFNLSNLEFPDLRRVNREDICAVFGVDPRMIGVASATKDGGLSGAQYNEARSRLVQHTVEPLLEAIEDQLNLWLAPEFGDYYIKFDRDALRDLIEDDNQTSVRVEREFKAGLRGWNESREALRLSPEPDPLELFLQPMGAVLVPAALLSTPPEDEPPTPPGTQPPTTEEDEEEEDEEDDDEMEGEDEEEDEDEEDDDEEERKTRELVRSAIEHGHRVFNRSVSLSKEQRQELWKNFDERATREEAEYTRAARQLFAQERKDVAQVFEDARAEDDAVVNAALRKIKSNYKPGGEYHRRWLGRYRQLIGKTYRTAAAATASRLGLDFQANSPSVMRAIETRAARLADFVTETSSRQITAAVSAGRKAGMGAGQIANLVNKAVFGGMAETRSVLIARTETVGSMNEGEFDFAKDSGVMESKEWLTQGDDRVRETHAELDGVRIPMDDTFDNGLSYPGEQTGDASEVVNCRCTLLYYAG